MHRLVVRACGRGKAVVADYAGSCAKTLQRKVVGLSFGTRDCSCERLQWGWAAAIQLWRLRRRCRLARPGSEWICPGFALAAALLGKTRRHFWACCPLNRRPKKSLVPDLPT